MPLWFPRRERYPLCGLDLNAGPLVVDFSIASDQRAVESAQDVIKE